MKKIYTAPVVKEIKINIEQQVCAGSPDLFGEGYDGDQLGKEDFGDNGGVDGFEEWSFDWDEGF